MAACDRALSLALMLNVITVFCLVERQLIAPLNSENIKPLVLFLLIGSLLNTASLT